MQKLIIVRHGDYFRSGGLSPFGRVQINALATRLRPIIEEGATILIATSPAPRACESAQILGDQFGCDPEAYEVLLSDEDHYEDLDAAYDLIESLEDLADVIILVTHYEYAELLPYCFVSKKRFGIDAQTQVIPKGTAWVINLNDKTLTHVEHDELPSSVSRV